MNHRRKTDPYYFLSSSSANRMRSLGVNSRTVHTYSVSPVYSMIPWHGGLEVNAKFHKIPKLIDEDFATTSPQVKKDYFGMCSINQNYLQLIVFCSVFYVRSSSFLELMIFAFLSRWCYYFREPRAMWSLSCGVQQTSPRPPPLLGGGGRRSAAQGSMTVRAWETLFHTSTVAGRR